ncbi:DUF7167 family protein [Bacillus cereus]|uniref:DUF7167 family protein n=1 Tax=Bacillus cereus TaxID=1396 RepID=UPI0018F614D4|nr:hypothetical protein [Bacillus cereus]MBJ8023736.1 hypothetical protein [Bacillus cereus]
MAKFMFSVSTNFVGSTREEEIEIPDEVFEGIEEDSSEYVDIVNDYYEEWLEDNIETTWFKI